MGVFYGWNNGQVDILGFLIFNLSLQVLIASI